MVNLKNPSTFYETTAATIHYGFDFPLQSPEYKVLYDVVHRTHLIVPYPAALLIVGDQENYDDVQAPEFDQPAQLKTVPVQQVDVRQH